MPVFFAVKLLFFFLFLQYTLQMEYTRNFIGSVQRVHLYRRAYIFMEIQRLILKIQNYLHKFFVYNMQDFHPNLTTLFENLTNCKRKLNIQQLEINIINIWCCLCIYMKQFLLDMCKWQHIFFFHNVNVNYKGKHVNRLIYYLKVSERYWWGDRHCGCFLKIVGWKDIFHKLP